jgi:host factor-I protein
MSKKSSLQDALLEHLRSSGAALAIYLISGIKLLGRISHFDNYVIIIRREDNGQQQVVFKQAISTIVPVQES